MNNVSCTTYLEGNLTDSNKMTNGCTFDPATALLGIYPTNQLTDLQNDKKNKVNYCSTGHESNILENI